MIEAPLKRSGKEASDAGWVNVAILQKLILDYNSYGKEERAIIGLFGISDLYDSAFWQLLIERPDVGTILGINNSLYFATNHGLKLAKLLKREGIEDFSDSAKGSTHQLSGLIHVVLPEDVAKLTNPDRIILVIEATAGLYAVCAQLLGHSQADFGIAALDSGSDKSIVFAGLGDVAEAVRGVISDIWDRVLLGRHAQGDASLDLIAKSLPIINEIKKSKDSGSISPEQAELMKRKTIECATGIVDAGAMTIELEAKEITTARSLIHEKQLLLTSSIPEEAIVNNSTSEDDMRQTLSKLTEEVERLKSRRARAPSSRKPKASPQSPDRGKKN
jgi:hypothetical protein